MLFKESTHEYLNGEERYTSMTTLINNYKPKKDWDGIAQKYLDKHGSPKAVLLDICKKKEIPLSELQQFDTGEFSPKWVRGIWKYLSKKATDIGSDYHLAREMETCKLPNAVSNPVVEDTKYAQDLTTLKPGFIYPELLIYTHEYKIAGQADYIEITNEGKVKIRDYKTSETIDTEPVAYWNPKLKKKVVEKFRTPINHIPTINFYSYALQLSGYAYILEMHGYPLLLNKETGTAALTIEHILFKDKKLGIVDTTVDIIVPYLKKEIKSIFNHHKSLMTSKYGKVYV